MKRKYPILISKMKNQVICPNDYKIGWLVVPRQSDKRQVRWLKWGSFSSKEKALKCAKETIENHGERDIFVSEEPLELNINLEQVAKFKKIN